MRKFSIRNIIIAVLCFTIICLGFGFCIVSTELSEYKKNGTNYDVRIVSIEDGTVIKGGATSPSATYSIVNNGHTADFLFNVYNKKDSMTYTAVIKNIGDISVKIDKVIESLNYNKSAIKPITIQTNDISGQVLKSGEEINLVVSVEYGTDGVSSLKNIPYEISILTSSDK